MGRAKSRVPKFLVAFAGLIVLLVVFHAAALRVVGRFLVRADSPAKADIALVLGGDPYGHRILTAAELVKQGYVPRVLVSGPEEFYGHYECDLAIPFVVKHGYPESWFVPCPNEGHSTREEAAALLAELQRRNIHSLLLVTSNFHTRRAGKIYRALAPGLTVRVVAAPDEFFRPEDWWRSRQGRKAVFLEWSKTVAEWAGL